MTVSQPTSIDSRLSPGRSVLGFVVCLLVAFAAAAVGAVASTQAKEFYAALTRPTWAPPAWLFAPVWSALYTAMAVASYLVWRQRGATGVRRALVAYVAQLILNALWSWLFFVWHLGAASTVEIVVLWIFIVFTLVLFWRISRPAAWLLLPYLAWVSFATALCAATWRLNPGTL